MLLDHVILKRAFSNDDYKALIFVQKMKTVEELCTIDQHKYVKEYISDQASRSSDAVVVFSDEIQEMYLDDVRQELIDDVQEQQDCAIVFDDFFSFLKTQTIDTQMQMYNYEYKEMKDFLESLNTKSCT